jgi:restriction endonuclease S subunit
MKSTAKFARLIDLASVMVGHPMRGAVDHLPQGNVRMVQMRDVDIERGLAWDTAAQIEPPGKRSANLLQSGDVLFTTRGTRNVAIMLKDVPGPAICAPNLFIIRLRDRRTCLEGYLAWFINERPGQAYFQRSATGTNILNIRREVLEQFEIPVPSLAEQQAIVDFADAARAERDLLRGLIKNRDQQLEALALGLANGEGVHA